MQAGRGSEPVPVYSLKQYRIVVSMKKNELKDDLSNYDNEAFQKPSVTVDVALCTIIDNDVKVLLITRKHPPCRGQWALPGGFVDISKNETLEKSAAAMLLRETNVKNVYIEQLKTYGAPGRDPRTRVITVAYFALVPFEKIKNEKIIPTEDALETEWFSLRELPAPLAFDHGEILDDLLSRLIGKISYTPIGFQLVPEQFTWSELQQVYEIILGEKLITPNFRRKIKDMYEIHELKEKKKSIRAGRPGICLEYISQKKPY